MPTASRRQKTQSAAVSQTDRLKVNWSHVLAPEQQAVWPQLRPFQSLGVLGGGTALAFQLGHRQSVDFDFFCFKNIASKLLLQVKSIFGVVTVLVNTIDELTFLTRTGVKVTFVYYPFTFRQSPIVLDGVRLLPELSIAATKAYTLNRRSEVKDYVDLYYVLQSDLTVAKIIVEAKVIFGEMFSEKLFLAQLVYFGDVSATDLQKVIFVGGKHPTLPQLKKFFERVVSTRL